MALFNPTGGYASYIVPAAFILILEQTLLMGSAILGGLAFEQGGKAGRRGRSRPTAVIGQAIAHLLLVLPSFALYLISCHASMASRPTVASSTWWRSPFH
ncbi:hypothetical protein [Rhizobium sp. LjRoot258]|uniref:hypothetical protein n=1 Tax=Rhizobium sp. LjRoot258 TaxID=3342299 RepID=UPI003ED169E4